jgi:DNA (cytosine-5)-methyltransferase 1
MTTSERTHSRGGVPRTRSRRPRPSTATSPCRVAPPQRTRCVTHPPLRIADLFAGIGGFHLGWHQVGAVCSLAVERDLAARETYRRNFLAPAPDLFANPTQFPLCVENVMKLHLAGVDVVCAGFPCQPFSDAGCRRGFTDKHGGAFFEVLRLLAEARPPAFLLENVRGLVSHRRGETLRQMVRLLQDEAGYHVQGKVLWAKDFGLPQLRPRLFLVGFTSPSASARFRFPEPLPLGRTLEEVLGGRCDRQVAYTVLASGRGKPVGAKRNWDGYLVDGREHRLSIDQVRQLQGFPDGFWLPPTESTAMRLLGNAVAPPVVAALAHQMTVALRGASRPPVRRGCRERPQRARPGSRAAASSRRCRP